MSINLLTLTKLTKGRKNSWSFTLKKSSELQAFILENEIQPHCFARKTFFPTSTSWKTHLPPRIRCFLHIQRDGRSWLSGT
jgi:hypothetical protein